MIISIIHIYIRDGEPITRTQWLRQRTEIYDFIKTMLGTNDIVLYS